MQQLLKLKQPPKKIVPKSQNFLDNLNSKDFDIEPGAEIDDSDKEDFSQIIVNAK